MIWGEVCTAARLVWFCFLLVLGCPGKRREFIQLFGCDSNFGDSNFVRMISQDRAALRVYVQNTGWCTAAPPSYAV